MGMTKELGSANASSDLTPKALYGAIDVFCALCQNGSNCVISQVLPWRGLVSRDDVDSTVVNEISSFFLGESETLIKNIY